MAEGTQNNSWVESYLEALVRLSPRSPPPEDAARTTTRRQQFNMQSTLVTIALIAPPIAPRQHLGVTACWGSWAATR